MSQMARAPELFCQRMSIWPSPLKSVHPQGSRLSRRCPGSTAGVNGASYKPDETRAGAILPKNVGLVIAVEIARAGDLPGGRHRWQEDAAAKSGVVHEPEGTGSGGILPENVCLAVTVEIAFHGSRC